MHSNYNSNELIYDMITYISNQITSFNQCLDRIENQSNQLENFHQNRIALKSYFFHIYTKINGRVSNVTIDSNFITPYVIEKFSLTIEFHTSPHYFRWDDETITYVNCRCLVPFKFSHALFEVCCDVMPVEGPYLVHLRGSWFSDINGFYEEKYEDFIIEHNVQKTRVRHPSSKASKIANPINQTSHLESKHSLEPKLSLEFLQGMIQLELVSLKKPSLNVYKGDIESKP